LTLSTRSQNETRRFWRKDHRGVNLISDALPFGRLWYGEPNAISNAIGYATHRSRSHDAVIRVYDDAGNVTEVGEHKNRTALSDKRSPGREYRTRISFSTPVK